MITAEQIQHAIDSANEGDSKLNPEILNIQGMSSSKIRHLLNNICSHESTRYLEIGTWKGSTLISALYGNASTIDYAYAIENFSEFNDGRVKQDLHNNVRQFLKPLRIIGQPIVKQPAPTIIEKHAFEVDVNRLQPINVYFYDGDHNPQAQQRAFTHYNQVLTNPFLAIVDDWNYSTSKMGTRMAFNQLNYRVLNEWELPSRGNGDTKQWWNGLYLALIEKP